jgi:hypothetical protein
MEDEERCVIQPDDISDFGLRDLKDPRC